MLAYFTKATYTNGIYKISDFYTGNTYKLTPGRSLDILLEASDGVVLTKPTTGILGDSTNIRDYTHMLVPSQKKIYRITKFIYVNINQTSMVLEEDPLLGNYIELQSKQLLLSRTNDSSSFIGSHNLIDIATLHNAAAMASTTETNATGPWVLFTFQKDVIDLEFEIGEIDNYASVGSFPSLTALELAYPRVNTTTPYEVDYYLKFAEVTSANELYQAIYSNEGGNGVTWVEVHRNPTFTWLNDITRINKTKYTSGIKISNLGDISTVQVAFPIDSTLVVKRKLTTTASTLDEYFNVPSFNSIKSWNNTDKLLSVKLVPQELLGIQNVERADVRRITRIDISSNILSAVKTIDTYLGKEITDGYLNTELLDQSVQSDPPNITMTTVKQFKDIFTFDNWSHLVDVPTDYEPFKKYFLYFYGEMIEIPARYLKNGFKIRLAVTATDVLYEVYTDKQNVIGSGRLMWFTRYAVDQLKLFEANNPTYKEQFIVNQFAGILKGGVAGGVGGFMAGSDQGSEHGRMRMDDEVGESYMVNQPSTRIPSAFKGVGVGIGSAVANTAANTINLMFMQKGLRDKADQIFGQNDVSMSIIRGFGVYLVVVTPEQAALNQMNTGYLLNGFSANKLAKINTLPYETNSIFGSATIVHGQLLEVVKNQYITDEINRILRQGIILVP